MENYLRSESPEQEMIWEQQRIDGAKRKRMYAEQFEPAKKEWIKQFIYKNSLLFMDVNPHLKGECRHGLLEIEEPKFHFELFCSVVAEFGVWYGYRREAENSNLFKSHLFYKNTEIFTDDPDTIADQLIEAGVPYCINDGKLVFYKYNGCINPNTHLRIMEKSGTSVRISSTTKPFKVYYNWGYGESEELAFRFVATKTVKIERITKQGMVLLSEQSGKKYYQYTVPPGFVMQIFRSAFY